MENKAKTTVTVGIKVDDTELKAAMAKAERLVELLTEANRLIGELHFGQRRIEQSPPPYGETDCHTVVRDGSQ